jgi:hypothetical protein
VANRSCAAGSWFTELRTLDDDDGDLANGTPHAAAIFAAVTLSWVALDSGRASQLALVNSPPGAAHRSFPISRGI